MKFYLVRLFILALVVFVRSVEYVEAAAKPQKEVSVAIQKIHDRAAYKDIDDSRCFNNGLWTSPGNAMREVLTDELVKLGGAVTVVERESLREIYEDEFNQENFDESTIAERKKFLASNYAIAGSLSEFEWCASGSEGSINIGALLGVEKLAVGRVGSKAHVAVDLRLIHVRTGKIVSTVHAEGKIDDTTLGFSGDAFGVKLKLGSFDKTPLGKAARIAMADAAVKLHSEILSQR